MNLDLKKQTHILVNTVLLYEDKMNLSHDIKHGKFRCYVKFAQLTSFVEPIKTSFKIKLSAFDLIMGEVYCIVDK